MNRILKEDKIYIIRLDKNEELINEVIKFCGSENISSAVFSVIGSASEVTISYFNLESKQYEDHHIKENLEIVGVTGNVALFNGKLIIHTHGVLAKKDLSTIGGHIKQLIISATAEISFRKLDSGLNREFNSNSGLNLLVNTTTT